jgi:hypothetical protein
MVGAMSVALVKARASMMGLMAASDSVVRSLTIFEIAAFDPTERPRQHHDNLGDRRRRSGNATLRPAPACLHPEEDR